MKLIKYDDELIEINKIKDITSIEYKDLILTSAKDKIKIIPGFIVMYGLNKSLYLTEQDKYFEIFVKRLREVYQEEKDNVVKEGIFGVEGIKIDNLTKSLLMDNNLEKTYELYDYYHDKDSYDKSLFFEEDKFRIVFDTFKYHLIETLKMFDISIDNISLSGGVNGNYYLSVIIDNTPRILPINYIIKDDISSEVTIGNIFNGVSPLTIDITFYDNRLSVISKVDKYKYYETNTYGFDNSFYHTKEIIIDNNTIMYKKDKIDSVEANKYDNLINIDSVNKDITWYKLPWNSYIGVNLCISKYDTSSIITNKFIYLLINDNNYYLKELYYTKYQKQTSAMEEMMALTLDKISKETFGIKNNDVIMIETFFDNDGINGFYKDKLSRNYFYHLSPVDSIELITKDNAISLGRENKINDKVDLLNVKKYIKGRCL